MNIMRFKELFFVQGNQEYNFSLSEGSVNNGPGVVEIPQNWQELAELDFDSAQKMFRHWVNQAGFKRVAALPDNLATMQPRMERDRNSGKEVSNPAVLLVGTELYHKSYPFTQIEAAMGPNSDKAKWLGGIKDREWLLQTVPAIGKGVRRPKEDWSFTQPNEKAPKMDVNHHLVDHLTLETAAAIVANSRSSEKTDGNETAILDLIEAQSADLAAIVYLAEALAKEPTVFRCVTFSDNQSPRADFIPEQSMEDPISSLGDEAKHRSTFVYPGSEKWAQFVLDRRQELKKPVGQVVQMEVDTQRANNGNLRVTTRRADQPAQTN